MYNTYIGIHVAIYIVYKYTSPIYNKSPANMSFPLPLPPSNCPRPRSSENPSKEVLPVITILPHSRWGSTPPREKPFRFVTDTRTTLLSTGSPSKIYTPPRPKASNKLGWHSAGEIIKCLPPISVVTDLYRVNPTNKCRISSGRSFRMKNEKTNSNFPRGR